MRKQSFLDVGGSSEKYRHADIEDYELGLRLERLSSDSRVKTYIGEDLWVLFDLGPLESGGMEKIGGSRNYL